MRPGIYSILRLKIFPTKQLQIQAESINFLLVFLAVKDDKWLISDCQYESINHLTWILSSPMLSSSARSSRIWMPGNFSVSKESSNRFSCSSVNAVRRRLCRDLSPIRNNSDCKFLAIVGYLVLNTHWADFNYSTIASCLRTKAINQSMDVNGKQFDMERRKVSNT